jgi:DNA-binding NarL/FixJ family response regulator
MDRQGQTTRVVIADDCPVVLAGLRAVLAQETEYLVVDEAQDGSSVIQAVDRLAPDLVVMDMEARGAARLNAIADIKKRHPTIRVLMLSGNRSRRHVLAALRAGANGYVLKEASIPELLAALGCMRKGQTYLSPGVTRFVINAWLGRSRATS